MAEILEEIRISAMYNPVKLGKIYLPGSHWVDTELILMGDGHIFQFLMGEKHITSLILAVGVSGDVVLFLPNPLPLPPPHTHTPNDERLNLIIIC